MADEASSRRAKLTVVAHPRELTTVRVRTLAQAVFAVPPLALVVVAAVLAIRGGGTVTEQWAPVAVGTGLGLAGLAAVGAVTRIPRTAVPAVAATWGFIAWSALSLLWSQAPAATVDDMARMALLGVAMVVGASYAARVSVATALAVAIGAAGALLAVLVEAKIFISTTGVFSGPRLPLRP